MTNLLLDAPRFNHIDLNLPKLQRETIDGIRYYKIPITEELVRFVSITSVTSHFNKEKFVGWRKRVGDIEANRITKAATDRGTAMHSLVENYLLNEPLKDYSPLPKLLFDIAKPALNEIGDIYGIELGMYSEYFKIAGTTDCIADFRGELSIIDFKTSKEPKPRDWIDSYFVQAVAYSIMFYELTGYEAKQLVIIMACENGECEVYIEKDIQKYLKLLVKYIKKFTEDKLNEYQSR